MVLFVEDRAIITDMYTTGIGFTLCLLWTCAMFDIRCSCLTYVNRDGFHSHHGNKWEIDDAIRFGECITKGVFH